MTYKLRSLVMAGVITLACVGLAYAAQDVEIRGTDGTNATYKVRVDSNGRLEVVSASGTSTIVGGSAADDAAASGNPVPIGCKYNTTKNTVEDGDVSYAMCGSRGSLDVTLYTKDTANALSGSVTNADNLSVNGTAQALSVVNYGTVYDAVGDNYDRARQITNTTDSTGTGIAAAGLVAQCDDTAPTATTENQFGNGRIDCTSRSLLVGAYNGSTAEPQYNNRDVTVFASAARTATPTPFDGTNYAGRGLHCVIDETAHASTPSVVFTIQGKDAVSGKFYTLLASAAIVGEGTTVLRVYPGLTAAGNLVATDIVPRTWRVIATHGNSDSITYSVGCSVIH